MGIPRDRAALASSLQYHLDYLDFFPPEPGSFDDVPVERMGASVLLTNVAMTGEGPIKRFAKALLDFMKLYSRDFYDPTNRDIYLRFADEGLSAYEEPPIDNGSDSTHSRTSSNGPPF